MMKGLHPRKLKEFCSHRLRMGKYRVIYHIEDGNIIIAKVDSRGDIYK